MKLKGKVVVVTGAGSGIGRALAKGLIARGARVAAVDLRQEGLDELSAELDVGERLSRHVLDVTDADAVQALPESVIASHGAVDGVINNAGIIQPFVPFVELGSDVVDRLVQVNLYGPIRVLRAFLPHLADRPVAHVVNVSSMGGFMPFPGQTMYGATKAAVKLLTEGLYAELADTSIAVSVVMPGAVATNIGDNSGVASPVPEEAAASSSMRPLASDAAATIILDGIEADRLHILVGRDARALSWMQRIAPAWSIRFIQRQMKSMLGG